MKQKLNPAGKDLSCICSRSHHCDFFWWDLVIYRQIYLFIRLTSHTPFDVHEEQQIFYSRLRVLTFEYLCGYENYIIK